MSDQNNCIIRPEFFPIFLAFKMLYCTPWKKKKIYHENFTKFVVKLMKIYDITLGPQQLHNSFSLFLLSYFYFYYKLPLPFYIYLYIFIHIYLSPFSTYSHQQAYGSCVSVGKRTLIIIAVWPSICGHSLFPPNCNKKEIAAVIKSLLLECFFFLSHTPLRAWASHSTLFINLYTNTHTAHIHSTRKRVYSFSFVCNNLKSGKKNKENYHFSKIQFLHDLYVVLLYFFFFLLCMDVKWCWIRYREVQWSVCVICWNVYI